MNTGGKYGGPMTKTRKRLIRAMAALLEKKSFQKITVNDICQEAMVSRGSFYTYFDDKYDIAIQMVGAGMAQWEMPPEQGDIHQRLEIVLKSVYDKRKILKNLIFADMNGEFIQILHKFYIGSLAKEFKKLELSWTQEQIEMVSAFVAHGLAGIIGWWAQTDFAVPAEEVAKTQAMIFHRMKEVQKNEFHKTPE